MRVSRPSVSILSALLCFWGGYVHALSEVSDNELSRVNGSGIAFALDDFRYQAAPSSYLWFIGAPPPSGSTFQRGDVYYYGLSMTGEGGGNYFDGAACSGNSTISGYLGCPQSTATIANFSPFDNPYLLRVFSYSDIGYSAGSYTNVARTIFEFVGPSDMDTFRWGFWGEIQVDKGGSCTSTSLPGSCLLQSQTLIWGKPTSPYNPANVVADSALDTNSSGSSTLVSSHGYQGSVMRMFQNDASADNTFGFIYESHLSGDFRFSVNQQNFGSEQQGTAPHFSTQEGVYFRNVAAYLPFGQMHYQALTFNEVASSPGNFVIELNAVPNNATAYNDFYSLPVADSYTAGYQTVPNTDTRYFQTHGYAVWGMPGLTNSTGSLGATGTKTTDTSNGIYFVKGDASPTFTASASTPGLNPSGNPPPPTSYSYGGLSNVNIGDAYITGMLVQHMKMTTCSAGAAGSSPC